MKNKMIINSFNKVNCEKKEVIYERIFFKKRFNYKHVLGFAMCLLFIIIIGYPRQEEVSPLNVKIDNTEITSECEDEDLECIIEKKREKE
jgi:hypothetical protein